MKKFEAPEMEVMNLAVVDVLTASTCNPELPPELGENSLGWG